MQFLLMSKEKIAASKATRAVWTLEWFLFCVRALMALQMFESCKGATAGCTAMGPWFVRFRRRYSGCISWHIFLRTVFGYYCLLERIGIREF
jgi:hypothetical protein